MAGSREGAETARRKRAEGCRMSQNREILEYLESGKTLTPAEALEMFGCFRLAARINDLRTVGYRIKTRVIRYRRAKFAEYRLVDS
jgi:hypothetical protein